MLQFDSAGSPQPPRHLVSIEAPYCSYAPQVAEIPMQLYEAVAEFIKPKFDEIRWPSGLCAARDVFAP